MKHLTLILIGISLFFSNLTVQYYYSERSLEKSFEQTNFFFTPNFVNPYGMKGLASIAPGFMNDPLLNLSLNPAYVFSDSLSENYLYVDFRTNSDLVDQQNYFISPLASARVDDMRIASYPMYYINTRKSIEPVFSAAFLTRPLAEMIPEFSFGFSYQAIFQDEEYYSIPQDIYNNMPGYDYAGNRIGSAESTPVINKSGGENNMHHTGHFISLFAGYDLTTSLTLGVKINRSVFDRNGEIGYNNLWFNDQLNSSTWYNTESRNQSYGHWDLNGGLQYRFDDGKLLGANLGFLSGTADQDLNRRDTSYYLNGIVNTPPTWNFNHRNSRSDQTWDHSGNTYYGGMNYRTQLSSDKNITIAYQFQSQNFDIANSSAIIDSSSYSSRYEYSGNWNQYESEYSVFDVRHGKGSSLRTMHRGIASLNWKFDQRRELFMGITIESDHTELMTTDGANVMNSSTNFYSSNTSSSNSIYKLSENKNVEWRFITWRTTIQIPLLFTIKTSDFGALLFGINRRMTEWEIEDVTTQYFTYRTRIESGISTTQTNFAEQYTSPKKQLSDIETTFIGGFTVTPAPQFNLRLLVSPTINDRPYADSQLTFTWWIGITIYP